MHVVVFNGPPYCGKDTLARMLADYIESHGISAPAKEESLSLPLRHVAYAMVGETYNDASYAAFKETPFVEFGNHTGRQLMIDVSESFLKQVYGEKIMAQMLVARNSAWLDTDGVLLIRDGGFQIEINALLDEVIADNIYVVQIHRDGCSFDNDSREWVRHPNSARMTQVWNNGSLDDLRTEAARIYGRLVNQMGWKL